jgi:hypothetical protein
MLMRPLPMNILSFVSLLVAGGCTLLVGTELSDKPAETGGAGGQGGSGTTSGDGPTGSAASTGAASSGAASSGGPTSGSSGAAMCPPNTANCDGIAAHGCNVNLQTDPDHCGSCANVCMAGLPPGPAHCAGGKCK